MKNTMLIVVAGLFLGAGTCEARLYRWVDHATGRVQMAGKPPAWYRAGRAGPRVLVYENGRLVDDTQRDVSLEEQQALRDNALEHAQAEQRALAEQATKVTSPLSALLESNSEAKAKEDAAAVARLKALIADWEQRQTDSAKHLIETQSAEGVQNTPDVETLSTEAERVE